MSINNGGLTNLSIGQCVMKEVFLEVMLVSTNQTFVNL